MSRSASLATAAALGLLTAAGCSEEYFDDPLGVLDLSSVYDGGTRANPVAGLPEQINPQLGYLDGEQAEYYDFGLVSAVRDPATAAPTAVTVRPMYFFFTPDGLPLFSAPVREQRDGSDWMLGGREVRDPNPKDFCEGVPPDEQQACTERNQEEKQKPYPIRYRALLVDQTRMSADYQRPIVDVSPADTSGNDPYTGLWEIVEITAPRGYQPDAIKHAATLDRAVRSGGFRRHYTGKVIDCPMIDERTHVPRGVTDRPTPRPRIELWYRRKLSFCYLVHGWETLGNDRVDTFDVARVLVGQAQTATTRLVVPIARAYVPTIFTSDQGANVDRTRVVDNLITTGRPRRVAKDPSGYTPIRWMFDLRVPPEYASGALRSIEAVDLSSTAPQPPPGSTTGIIVRNIALRGIAVKCDHVPITKKAGTRGPDSHPCGKEVPNPDDPTGPTLVDARNDPTCTEIGLECNKDSCYCDAPFVGYGQLCGPGVAQCSKEQDKFSEHGYTCFPPWGGFCYLSCNPAAENTRSMENQGKQPPQFVDTRCKELPGYACLRSAFGPLCLKFCDENITDTDERKQCSTRTKIEDKDIAEGQTCQNLGLEVCAWPDHYTPSQ